MTTKMKTIERIRASYTPREISKFDELKELDRKVKRPAQIFAYVFGSTSSLVLGTGMSLAMKIIGTTLSFAMPLGVAIGVVGIGLVSTTYPLYKKILNSRKKRYAKQIFELSDSLLNN